MPIRPRQCLNEDCPDRIDGEGRRFDILCRDGLGKFYDCDADVSVESDMHCGVCGSTDLSRLVPNARAIFTGDVAGIGKIYPYYDRSLCLNVLSHAHHKRVMKERNLFHIERRDVEVDARRIADEDARIVKWGENHDREVEESPDYAEFRRLRDKGAFVQHVPKNKREQALKYQMKNVER